MHLAEGPSREAIVIGQTTLAVTDLSGVSLTAFTTNEYKSEIINRTSSINSVNRQCIVGKRISFGFFLNCKYYKRRNCIATSFLA